MKLQELHFIAEKFSPQGCNVFVNQANRDTNNDKKLLEVEQLNLCPQRRYFLSLLTIKNCFQTLFLEIDSRNLFQSLLENGPYDSK